MELTSIKELIDNLIEQGSNSYDVAEFLGVSVSMVSSYKLHSYNPSLTVAKTVYSKAKIALHPFAEESLKFELDKK